MWWWARAISPSVVVDVEDQFGNLVTTDNSMVTLSLNGAATLNGTQAVQAKNGVATFGGLSVSDAGVYTIDASDGVLASVTSVGFHGFFGDGGNNGSFGPVVHYL